MSALGDWDCAFCGEYVLGRNNCACGAARPSASRLALRSVVPPQPRAQAAAAAAATVGKRVLTAEQMQRMEENRLKALAKRATMPSQ